MGFDKFIWFEWQSAEIQIIYNLSHNCKFKFYAKLEWLD